jgi:hypothetical protein
MNSLIRGIVLYSLIVPGMTMACFDTYLFLQKSDMVYPQGQMVLEGSGEYIMAKMNNPGEDFLSGGTNLYYGFSKRFSMQVGISSSEKERANFAIDGYGLRAVYGLVQGYKGVYNLDVILEHASTFDFDDANYEISMPNIFHVNNFTFVIHPVTSFGTNFNLRGHGGIFYHINGVGIVGIGSEYASAQTSSRFNQRLVRGEGATSLFFGSQMGRVYLQNEFIKGWGENGGNDFGFAATVKFTLPSFSH